MSAKTLICLHRAPVVGVSDVFLLPEANSIALVESNASSCKKLHDDEPKKFDFFMKAMHGSDIIILGSVEDSKIHVLDEPSLLLDFDSIFHDVVMKGQEGYE